MKEVLDTLRKIANLFEAGCSIAVDDEGICITGTDVVDEGGDPVDGMERCFVENRVTTERSYGLQFQYGEDDEFVDVLTILVDKIKADRKVSP